MLNQQTPGSSSSQSNSTTGPATITFSIPEENLHVMPRQYQAVKSHAKVKSEGRGGNGRFFLLLGGLAILLGAIIVGLLLYVRSQQAPPTPPVTTTVDPTNTSVTVASTTPTTALVTPEGRDAIRVQDLTKLQQALTAYYSEQQMYPQVLAGMPQKFLLTEPKDPLTAQPYVYGADLNGQSYHLEFILERQVIFNNKTLEAGAHRITPEGSAVTVTPPVTVPEPVPVTVLGDNQDTDRDGLTNAEELTFRTIATEPDTDADGYKDAEEVLNLFSPIGGQRAFLNVSGLVKLYTNQAYGYTTWIPQSWVYRSLDATDQEVVLTSPLGDSVIIKVEMNDANATLDQWFTATFGEVALKAARRLTVAAKPALESADGLSWYQVDGQKIYRVTYDAATSGVINYPNVFILIRQAFNLLASQ